MQSINIQLKKASKEEFSAAMSVFSGQGLNIGIRDAKNAGEIRKKDAELKSIEQQLKKAEDLKPKRCDCSCNNAPAAAAPDSTDYEYDAITYK